MAGEQKGDIWHWGWIAVLIAVLLLSLPFSAEASARTVRVGYYMFDGYQMQDDEGRRSGYGYDFLQEAARYTGWRYEYIGYTYGWASLEKMLEQGEIDLLTSARKTPARERRYLFSAPIGTSAGILSVKSGSTRLNPGDYANYNGIRVGQIKDSSINANFRRFAEEKGFTYEAVDFQNADEMDAALQAGGIDAVCTTNLRRGKNEWIVDQFDEDNFYAMLRPDEMELKLELDAAIRQMDFYSPGWRTVLWSKYYRPDFGEQLSFTAEEKKFIRQQAGKRLTVLVNPDNVPYSYFMNGEAQGILPEILKEIARRTGLQLEIVQVTDRAAYFTALQEHAADLCLDCYFAYDKLEKNGYRSTIPYFSTPLTQISRKDLQHEPVKIALLQDADYAEFTAQLTEDKIITYYPSLASCVAAVRSGDADAAYAYPYSAQKYLEEEQMVPLTATLLPQYTINFSIVVGADADQRLLAILNKAAASVRGKTVDDIVLRHFEQDRPQLTLQSLLYQHPFAGALLAALLVVLVSAVLFSLSRQRMLRLIQQKNQALREAVQQATEANEAKSQFLSGISHDMRTPLNGILGFTRFALKEKDPVRQQENLKKIQQSGSVLLELINNTLDLSRIESGKFILEPEWIYSHDVVDSVLVVIRAAAEKKQQKFLTDLVCPVNEMVYVDRLRIQELFLNLLSNAVKYTKEGGTIWLRVKHLPENADGHRLQVEVEDTGIGISREFLPRLYEPFAQERQMEMRMTTGSGLGLAIVKRIVDLMQGSIRVESELGKGTKFIVRLPIEIRQQPQQNKQTAERRIYDFSDAKLLLCEDNQLNSEIAAALLEEKNARVVWAENGKIGTEIFAKSMPGEFAAVFMDIHMPVMGGYEAVACIRSMKRPDAKRIPIIAMTADAYAEDVKKCLAAGMDAHLAKPIEPQELYDVLQRMLDGKKAE